MPRVSQLNRIVERKKIKTHTSPLKSYSPFLLLSLQVKSAAAKVYLTFFTEEQLTTRVD